MSQVFNAKSTDSSDLYGTPRSAFDLLAPYLPKDKLYWEPCRGYGAIEGFLRDDGQAVVSSDLQSGQDALLWQPEAWDIAVTNPPWSLKGEFFARHEKVVCLDADAAKLAAHDASPLGVNVSPSDIAYVIYTSGSTGTPSFIAGPKIVNFDRVEWHTIPDSGTAGAAPPAPPGGVALGGVILTGTGAAHAKG